jgi:two-component system phosphate regulon response regulator OmpR
MGSVLPRILIVEDDQDMADMIADLVQSEGWTGLVVPDAPSAFAVLEQDGKMDIALIDHNLPGLSGRALAQRIRDAGTHHSGMGIIMVTAAGTAADRVLGLQTAADDYVVKPFEPVELAARIRALLRRMGSAPRTNEAPLATSAIEIGDWVIDPARRKAWSRSDPGLALTASEFTLIETLARCPGKPISRTQLMTELGMDDSRYVDRNVDVLVLRLRRKIEVDATRPRFIRTMRGRGYVLMLDRRP